MSPYQGSRGGFPSREKLIFTCVWGVSRPSSADLQIRPGQQEVLGRLEDLWEKLLLLLDREDELAGRKGDLRWPRRSPGHHQLRAGAGQSAAGKWKITSFLAYTVPKIPLFLENFYSSKHRNSKLFFFFFFLAQIHQDWPSGSKLLGGGEKRWWPSWVQSTMTSRF